MDLFGINIDLNTLTGSNLTIIIGVFVTLVVMGSTTVYDKRKSKNKTLPKIKESEPSLNLNQKIKDFSSKYMDDFSGFSKKFSNLIPKRANKTNLENIDKKSPKSTGEIPKIFGTIKSKISSFSINLRGKKNKFDSGQTSLQSNQKTKASKFSENEKISGFDFDKIVESKKGELSFDDSILAEMSTASSLKGSNKAESLNSDLEFDKNEFDIGFGGMNDESSEDDALFNTGAEKMIDLADDKDNLLDSLKKDIVITKEKKINFMSAMEGQDLDLKTLKPELQGVLKHLKEFNQHSNRN